MSYKKTITLDMDYSGFVNGISECDRKMKILDQEFAMTNEQMKNAASTSEKYAAKKAYLTQKIQMQTLKVDESRRKYDELVESKKATTKQIDAAAKAYLKEETSLAKLNNELKDHTTISSKSMSEMRTSITIITAIAAAYIGAANEAGKYADEIDGLSMRTGMTTDTIQKLEYACISADIEFGVIQGALRKLTKNMDDARHGTGNAAQAFDKLKLSTIGANGELKDSEEMFYEVIDALSKVSNETERDAISMDIFGKSATELNGMIELTSDGIKKLSKEAESLGIILSEGDIQSAAQFNDQLKVLERVLSTTAMKAGIEIIPVLTALVSIIASIPAPVLSSIMVMLSMVITLVTVGKMFSVVSDTVGPLVDMFKTMDGKMLQTVAIVLTVVAVLAALAIAIAVIIGKDEQFNRSMNSVGSAIGNNSNVSKKPNSPKYNARGSSNFEGGSTWVGEEGPELVDLPAGSRIYNHDESKKIGGSVNNYYVTIPAKDIKEFNDIVNIFKGLHMSRGRGGVIDS